MYAPHRQTAVLKLLLESGADLYAINNVSKTLVHVGCQVKVPHRMVFLTVGW